MTISAEETVRQMLDELPDNASFEDIEYRIYVRRKVERGLEDLAEGRVLDQEEVERRMTRWLDGQGGPRKPRTISRPSLSTSPRMPPELHGVSPGERPPRRDHWPSFPSEGGRFLSFSPWISGSVPPPQSSKGCFGRSRRRGGGVAGDPGAPVEVLLGGQRRLLAQPPLRRAVLGRDRNVDLEGVEGLNGSFRWHRTAPTGRGARRGPGRPRDRRPEPSAGSGVSSDARGKLGARKGRGFAICAGMARRSRSS